MKDVKEGYVGPAMVGRETRVGRCQVNQVNREKL